jgi:hypothetical protein
VAVQENDDRTVSGIVICEVSCSHEVMLTAWRARTERT